MKKFVIIDTETQTTKVLESNATTFGELKTQLIAEGFNLTGKSVQEGISKIEFMSDEALLPHDVPYRGTTTNDLVFRITKSNKNIESGANRAEIYVKIKELGVQDKIKEAFGKNYTQVSTDNLVDFINNSECSSVKEKTREPSKSSDDTDVKKDLENVHTAINTLVGILAEEGYITRGEESQISLILSAKGKSTNSELKTPYSSEEINEMFKDM